MFLETYLEALEELPFGKQLPNAVYIYRRPGKKLNPELLKFLTRLAQRAGVPNKCNVLKMHKEAPRVSFLYYPTFATEPHPALHSAVIVDCSNHGIQPGVAKAKRWDYAKSKNPPILHRKEEMLPKGHWMAEGWADLTRQEEEAGLFDDPTTIGNKLAWEELLKQKGYTITKHWDIGWKLPRCTLHKVT